MTTRLQEIPIAAAGNGVAFAHAHDDILSLLRDCGPRQHFIRHPPHVASPPVVGLASNALTGPY